MKIDKKIIRSLIFIILLLVALSFIYPLFYLFINAFKSKTDYMVNKFGFPTEGWHIENFVAIISQFKIFNYMKNTFIVAVISDVLILIISVLASFSFAKFNFRGKEIFYTLLISVMFIPAQVTMIPMYVLFSKFNLVNNHFSVILSYVARGIPSAILLLTANFRGIPREMIEAAKIDGCGYLSTVVKIVAPMGKSAMAISFIFTFLDSWNDLFTPMLLLPKTEVSTVIVALSSLVQRYATDQTYQMAGLAVSLVPALIIFLAFQKYIVKGITAGAVK